MSYGRLMNTHSISLRLQYLPGDAARSLYALTDLQEKTVAVLRLLPILRELTGRGYYQHHRKYFMKTYFHFTAIVDQCFNTIIVSYCLYNLRNVKLSPCLTK